MEDQILKQIQSILSETSITLDSTLIDTMDSITFIQLVVALENEFNFNFDDEMLIMAKYPTIKEMVEYVLSKII